MQFGAMNFPVIPVLEEIDTIARLGFDYLELAMDPPMVSKFTSGSSISRFILVFLLRYV